jgi:Domain of unknown function (DUF4424)
MRLSVVVTALGLAAPALANDSVAETRAGGLVLTRTSAIDMVSEDLFVSADEVRVRYVFRNDRARAAAIDATIAFPMPDRDLSEERYGDVAFPAGFRTWADGKPVAMQVERKAMLGATDHTALLARLGVPLGGDVAALDALPDAAKAELLRLGLAEVDEYDAGRGWERHLAPLWTVKETWHWDQAFRAGRDMIVEHRYRPGTGASVGTALVDPDFRRSPEGRAMIARYCIDSGFLGGLDRLARQAGGDHPTLPEERIGYVLTTGANWASPIADFRLVVDKGAPENLVSFCGEDVRKISATRFEMRRTNWRPDRDLDILIVKPMPR